MSDTPDLDALAKRYLDLWQEELERLASDKEVADAMARAIELMNAGAARFAGAMRGAGDDASGAAAARAPRGGADAGLERLAARVAELEKRVRALEGARRPAKAKPKPPAKPKPQSKRRRRAPGAARKRRS